MQVEVIELAPEMKVLFVASLGKSHRAALVSLHLSQVPFLLAYPELQTIVALLVEEGQESALLPQAVQAVSEVLLNVALQVSHLDASALQVLHPDTVHAAQSEAVFL
jgi:hypothetical protein